MTRKFFQIQETGAHQPMRVYVKPEHAEEVHRIIADLEPTVTRLGTMKIRQPGFLGEVEGFLVNYDLHVRDNVNEWAMRP